MFNWFKKKKPEPKCRHFKEAGHPHPDNMVRMIRFADYAIHGGPRAYRRHYLPFGIYQCTVCGARAFSAGYLHCMPPELCRLIDGVIALEVDMADLCQYLHQRGWAYVAPLSPVPVEVVEDLLDD